MLLLGVFDEYVRTYVTARIQSGGDCFSFEFFCPTSPSTLPFGAKRWTD